VPRDTGGRHDAGKKRFLPLFKSPADWRGFFAFGGLKNRTFGAFEAPQNCPVASGSVFIQFRQLQSRI